MFEKFFERRRDRIAQEKYDDGFDWAAGALLRKEDTPQSLDAQICERHHPFDRGATAAIDLLVEIKLVEDDRI